MNLPSLFGWLDNFEFWRNLSYPVKGAIIRAAKAALSVIVGALVAALGAGTLFPDGTSPIVILVVTAGLQAADKFLRELEAAKELGPVAAEAKAEPTKVNTDATVIEPATPVEEPPKVVESGPDNPVVEDAPNEEIMPPSEEGLG